MGLVDKLDFARDRPMECFLWTVGIFPDPRHSSCRIELTKAIAILLVIDDIYDSYGSLDELALFTDAVKRFSIFLLLCIFSVLSITCMINNMKANLDM